MMRVELHRIRYTCDFPECHKYVDVLGPMGFDAPPDWYYWIGDHERLFHFDSRDHAEQYAGRQGDYRVQRYSGGETGKVLADPSEEPPARLTDKNAAFPAEHVSRAVAALGYGVRPIEQAEAADRD